MAYSLVVINPIDQEVHPAIMTRVPVVTELPHEYSGQAEQHGDGKDEGDHGNDQVPSTIPHPVIFVHVVITVQVLTGELCDRLFDVQVVVEDRELLLWWGLL